ncbi:hypothetical protein [Amycolatopsis benzoatilytica]|uniref:hypothetical protein n=1 Tax=Amycolatopsis benzoatilytica TaxID=346045 RepID=UPI0003762CA4|nr:hypothetical protein [Amycolatopsis benzoatilytica]
MSSSSSGAFAPPAEFQAAHKDNGEHRAEQEMNGFPGRTSGGNTGGSGICRATARIAGEQGRMS